MKETVTKGAAASVFLINSPLPLRRPEEVLRAGAPGEGGLSGTGGAAAVSPPRGDTGCRGTFSIATCTPKHREGSRPGEGGGEPVKDMLKSWKSPFFLILLL